MAFGGTHTHTVECRPAFCLSFCLAFSLSLLFSSPYRYCCQMLICASLTRCANAVRLVPLGCASLQHMRTPLCFKSCSFPFFFDKHSRHCRTHGGQSSCLLSQSLLVFLACTCCLSNPPRHSALPHLPPTFMPLTRALNDILLSAALLYACIFDYTWIDLPIPSFLFTRSIITAKESFWVFLFHQHLSNSTLPYSIFTPPTMPTDYTAKMEALRSLHERLQAKEADIPESAYSAAGVKNKARIKDVEKELSATKKKIGAQIRNEAERAALKVEEEEAERLGLTLEEYREQTNPDTKKGGPNAGGTASDFAAKQFTLERSLAAGRAKKEQVRSAGVEYDD